MILFKKLKLGDEIVLFLNTSVFEEKELTGNIIEIYSSPFSFKISISENYLKEILDVEGNLVLNNPTGIIQPYPRNFRSVANNSKKRLINICNYLIENKELPLLVENILKNKPQKILIDSNLNDLDSKGIFNIAKKLENAHLTIQGPPRDRKIYDYG